MRYITSGKAESRHGRLGNLFYVLANIGLAVTIFLLIHFLRDQSIPWFAVLMILVSKWRIFTVRPKYWWVNLQANIVDISVGLSYVGLLVILAKSSTSQQMILISQAVLSLGYALWLAVIKQLSSYSGVVAQAIIAIGSSLVVLFSISYDWSIFWICLMVFVVAYGAARHILMQAMNATDINFRSSIFGLLITQAAWICAAWNVGYPSLFLGQVKIPQAAIILMIKAILIFLIYTRIAAVTIESDNPTQLATAKTKVDPVWLVLEDLSVPLILGVGLMFVLMIWFSSAVV